MSPGSCPFSHLGRFYSTGICPGPVKRLLLFLCRQGTEFHWQGGVKLCMLWQQTRTVTGIQKVALNHCLVIHSGQLHLGK